MPNPRSPQFQRDPSAPSWSGRGPGLFAHLYFALLVQGLVLIHATYADSLIPEWSAIMGGALAVAAVMAGLMRLGMQDWYSSLSLAQRLIAWGAAGFIFIIPRVQQGHDALPEGFVFVLPYLIFYTFYDRLVQRYQMWAMIGFWCVLSTRPQTGIGTILAFGAATLWTFAASHFAFVGEPFGLRGWWPVRRVVMTVALFFIPCAIGAYAIYNVFPDQIQVRSQPASGGEPRTLVDYMSMADPADLRDLIHRLILSAIVLGINLIAFHYLRKFMARRVKPRSLPHIMGADISELEFFQREPGGEKPILAGTRGQVLHLWHRWARRQKSQETPAGETAAELAARVETARGESQPRTELTRLLEQAHYGAEEPTQEEVDLMRRWVKVEIDSTPRDFGEM